MNSYKKYFSFNGTSTRSEFWAVQLLTLVLTMVSTLLVGIISPAFGLDFQGPIALLMIMAILLSAINLHIATTCRRLRDAGVSPWFTLCLLIPYIGFIVFIIFGMLDSESKK